MQKLAELIKIVRRWPGISQCFSEKDFEQAVEAAYDDGRLQRFNDEVGRSPHIRLVVTPYLDTPSETFNYARARLNDALGGKLLPWHAVYEEPGFEQRLKLVDPLLTPNKRRIKIDVFDTKEAWGPHDGIVPAGLDLCRSASVQPLFAGALDPDWVRRMVPGGGTPPVILAGYEVEKLADGRAYSPHLWFDKQTETPRLGAWPRNTATTTASVPLLWR